MKKLLILAFCAIATCVGSAVTVNGASVNDFVISRYDIAFDLSRDSNQRSTLTTRETIVATFPESNQNHGIERYIPKTYDGHSTDLKIVAIKDASGKDWPYETRSSGNYTVLRIGDADTYVHGEQTFMLQYAQRDVTKSFANTGKDEFYWDTNGTEWRVPIEQLNVSLTIDGQLQPAMTGDIACYQGRYGATDRCNVARGGTTMTVSAANLSQSENITLAVGFASQTFAAYEQPLLERLVALWLVAQSMLIAVAVSILVWLIVRAVQWTNRKRDVGTIIPEYLPPKDCSVGLAAVEISAARSTFAAQLIDFAVRHYIKIYETKEKSFWTNAVYEIEIVKPIDDLRSEEIEFLTDLFDGKPAVGAKIDTKKLKKDYTLVTRMSDNPKKLTELMRTTYGLRQKDTQKSAWFKKTGYILLVASIVLLSPPLLIVALIAFLLGATLRVRTDKAVELYRYLEGLKVYISVAEQERLNMLQSPEGAEKTHVDGDDKKQLVKLYEKVLPYAILFGQEKQWSKQLGDYYESTGAQPDWYTGTNMAAFNAGAFAGAMSSLTTSIDSTGAASSSSGGSSGGGSSGGGGGGGGGGGW